MTEATHEELKQPLQVLIVEDDPDDRQLIRDLLRRGLRVPYHVHESSCLGEALEIISDVHVDVVLLDLGLPGGSRMSAIRDIRQKKKDAAIIVISGVGDEGTIGSCFEAGAHDYIQKPELDEKLLTRVVGYALYRIRDRQLQEITRNLEQYRGLTSAGSFAPVAGRMSGGGPLSERMPALFEEMLEQYREVVKGYMRYLAILKDKPSQEMERLATRIGDQGGGPRDLMDLHVEVIDEALRRTDGELSRAMTSESRLLALEMMGMLVNYYRIGTRRR